MLGSEDTEIQQRIHASEHLVCYSPDASVYHHVPASRMTKGYSKERHWGGIQSQAIMALCSQGKETLSNQIAMIIKNRTRVGSIAPKVFHQRRQLLCPAGA